VKDRAMTTTDHTASLHSIDRDALMTTDPAADVRDRRVLDKAGQDIGHVDDLLVDDREHKVRFLRVAAGGFLGLGEAKFLIPVDAITKVEAKAVHVDQTLDHVARGPRYDPTLMDESHLNDAYGHYGYSPWWGPGYMYPMFPYDPQSSTPDELAADETERPG
jgi:sporulation protein YlmC with PRC-barrel domain